MSLSEKLGQRISSCHIFVKFRYSLSLKISFLTHFISYNQISFSFDNLYMTSRLIEGQFPNYRGVIPPGSRRTSRRTPLLSPLLSAASPLSREPVSTTHQARVCRRQIHITSNNPRRSLLLDHPIILVTSH